MIEAISGSVAPAARQPGDGGVAQILVALVSDGLAVLPCQRQRGARHHILLGIAGSIASAHLGEDVAIGVLVVGIACRLVDHDGRRPRLHFQFQCRDARARLFKPRTQSTTGCRSSSKRIRLTQRFPGAAGTEIFKPANENVLRALPISKRINRSRADGDDPTLN